MPNHPSQFGKRFSGARNRLRRPAPIVAQRNRVTHHRVAHTEAVHFGRRDGRLRGAVRGVDLVADNGASRGVRPAFRSWLTVLRRTGFRCDAPVSAAFSASGPSKMGVGHRLTAYLERIAVFRTVPNVGLAAGSDRWRQCYLLRSERKPTRRFERLCAIGSPRSRQVRRRQP
jgi:hypothetical protein